MQTLNGKTALITGGSSGIGLAIAKQVAAMGANVMIMARDHAKLEKACTEIAAARQSTTQQIKIIAADVSCYEQVNEAVAQAVNGSGVPDMLVNSAGITYPGYFQDLNLQIFRDMMEVNYFGTLYITKMLVPGMIERRSGMIINLSSIVGLHGLIGYSAYSASKSAVMTLSDALRHDLRPFGIQVSVAFPTDTITPQLEFESKRKPEVLKVLTDENNTPVPPEDVARNILSAALKGRYFILPTTDARLLYLLTRLFPGESLYKLVDFLVGRARNKIAKNNGAH
jgi:3-dehydrosphinganine reductase